MNKRTKIIIGVIIGAIAIYFILRLIGKSAMLGYEAGRQEESAIPIPARVLKEPVSDWIGDTLTYQGVKYTPINGIWTVI